MTSIAEWRKLGGRVNKLRGVEWGKVAGLKSLYDFLVSLSREQGENGPC